MSDGSTPDPQHTLSASLVQITQAIATSLDVAGIFSIVAEQSAHILSFDTLAVLLAPAAQDSASSSLSLAYSHPFSIAPGRSWPLTSFSFGSALQFNQPIVVADFSLAAGTYAGDEFILSTMGRSAVIVPIRVAARSLGALIFVCKTPAAYRPADALLTEPIAGLLALALEHQRLDQQASALAVVEERNRLAREIHDTLAQSLTGIIINLESLKPFSAGRTPGDAEVLSETETLARGALEEARRSVLGLQPTPLQHQSLPDALAPELVGLAKRASLDTQFYTHGVERPLAPDVATALFRVAQEAFQNIYKHASARHVILGLAFEPDSVVLTVEDDGLGFQPDAVAPHESGGFGLLSMAARVRSLAGDLVVSSRPGHGTAMRATLPYVRPVVATAAVMLNGVRPALLPQHEHAIRVLIVDDQGLTREGIRRILDGQPDIEVVGEAADGLAAVEQTRLLQPDVILLDLQMPRLSGIEALPRLRAAQSQVEVVILTTFDQDEQVFAALKAGARGYVLKDAAPTAIMAAIRAASQGQAALSPQLATRIVERFTVLAGREVDPNALTEREVEVLSLMQRGQPYKEIATNLSITTHTVQYHVTNILQKLGVGSRGEAVAVAVQRGLLSIGN